MASKNTFGLSRYIPVKTTREVRARCGFGCVVCGSAIVDYEHFEPEFKDAKCHDPAGIILLCPSHHRAKGAFLSRPTIAEWAANPYCKREGFAWHSLDLQNSTTHIGPFIATNCEVVLAIQGEPVIWFSAPEIDGGPNRFNLVLRNQDGSDLVRIEDNVWSASPTASDIKLTSGDVRGLIEVTDEDGPVFRAHIYPPHTIDVEVYRSWVGGHHYAIGRDGADKNVVTKNGEPLIGYGSSGLRATNCYAAAVLS